MNNIFLYAVKPSNAYQAVESFVRTCQLNGRLIVLPPGSQFTSPLCLQLRSNDLIILFAQDESDINELLVLRDEYESFRIILIIEKEESLSSSNYLQLSPRFISFLDENFDELSEYLKSVIKIPSNLYVNQIS